MNFLVSVLTLWAIMFVFEWFLALYLQRLNRKSFADLAEALGMRAEMDQYLIDLIDDLRSIQPEKDEILEITALQIRSLRDSAADHRIALERMSTKLPFWIHLVPLSMVAKRQVQRRGGQRARTDQLREWRERHGHDDPDLP